MNKSDRKLCDLCSTVHAPYQAHVFASARRGASTPIEKGDIDGNENPIRRKTVRVTKKAAKKRKAKSTTPKNKKASAGGRNRGRAASDTSSADRSAP